MKFELLIGLLKMLNNETFQACRCMPEIDLLKKKSIMRKRGFAQEKNSQIVDSSFCASGFDLQHLFSKLKFSSTSPPVIME